MVFFVFVVFYFLRQGLTMLQVVLESHCTTQAGLELENFQSWLLSSGITGVYPHTQLSYSLYVSVKYQSQVNMFVLFSVFWCKLANHGL
jgi:hypothetical protein